MVGSVIFDPRAPVEESVPPRRGAKPPRQDWDLPKGAGREIPIIGTSHERPEREGENGSSGRT